ncbi:MAG: hypothetical protein ABF649_00550 [Bacillus sp. (in: firmicutes)]
MEAVKYKQPEATYIEEQEECILLEDKHWIWPVIFWAVFLIITILMGMGVVEG